MGWHVAATMPEKLVTTALKRAFLTQPPIPELIVHTDRGSQYGGNASGPYCTSTGRCARRAANGLAFVVHDFDQFQQSFELRGLHCQVIS